jgi:hypothetical protein
MGCQGGMIAIGVEYNVPAFDDDEAWDALALKV